MLAVSSFLLFSVLRLDLLETSVTRLDLTLTFFGISISLSPRETRHFVVFTISLYFFFHLKGSALRVCICALD